MPFATLSSYAAFYALVLCAPTTIYLNLYHLYQLFRVKRLLKWTFFNFAAGLVVFVNMEHL